MQELKDGVLSQSHSHKLFGGINKSHFLVLLQGSGVGEKLLLVVISDSSIRTCLHLCSHFVGEERGVHTQS